MAQLSNPISPTTSLPPLKSLSGCSTSQVVDALANLRALYFLSPLVESLRLQKDSKPYTVDSEITHTPYNPYSPITHTVFHFPSWFAGILSE